MSIERLYQKARSALMGLQKMFSPHHGTFGWQYLHKYTWQEKVPVSTVLQLYPVWLVMTTTKPYVT